MTALSSVCVPSVSTVPSLSSSSRVLFPAFGASNFPQLFHSRLQSGVKCSYAEAGVKMDVNSGTIDVVADVKTERIVVLGGSGFVGSAICKAAISKGIEVISLSRSGRPSYTGSWVDQVTWVTGRFNPLVLPQ